MSEKISALPWVVLGITLGLILLFGVRPLLPERHGTTLTYHNFLFEQIEGNWYFDWQRDNVLYTVSLRYSPYDVENTTIRGVLNESFNTRREIYVTFDPELGNNTKNFTTLALAATELTQSMARVLGFKPISACTRNSSSCAGIPIVTCATPNASVLSLTDIGTPGIILEQNCIILRGEGFGLLKSVDRLLYQWYGVMGERWANATTRTRSTP